MSTESTTTALTIASSADNVGMIIRNTPVSFQKNQLSHDNCLAACQTLLDEINSNGMTDELDQKAAKYIEKTRRTVKAMNELRAPVTKLFDQVRKEFTNLENDIDPTKSGTIPYQLQTLRNNYAAKKRSEEEARLRAEELKKRQELATLKYKEDLKDFYKNQFNRTVETQINMLTELNNSVTLDNYEHVYKKISAHVTDFPPTWNPDTNVLHPAHIPFKEAREIRNAIVRDLVDNQFIKQYKTEIGDYRQELLDKLPSKKIELEKAAKASAEEAEKIKAQLKEREALDAARKEVERIAREREEAKKEEVKKAGDEATNLFNLSQTAKKIYQPKAKVTKKINVIAPSGYMQIVSMWWAKEGCTLSKEELDKIFKKQIAFCEKLANKDGEFINDPGIEYTEDVKAQ